MFLCVNPGFGYLELIDEARRKTRTRPFFRFDTKNNARRSKREENKGGGQKYENGIYLDVIVAVVVEVDDPVQLGLGGHVDVVGVGDALGQGLAGVLLHLDVVKLPAKKGNESCHYIVIVVCRWGRMGKYDFDN